MMVSNGIISGILAPFAPLLWLASSGPHTHHHCPFHNLGISGARPGRYGNGRTRLLLFSAPRAALRTHLSGDQRCGSASPLVSRTARVLRGDDPRWLSQQRVHVSRCCEPCCSGETGSGDCRPRRGLGIHGKPDLPRDGRTHGRQQGDSPASATCGIGMAYTELAAAYPVAGGGQYYALRGLGDIWGFLGGSALLLDYTLDIAPFATASAGYFKGFVMAAARGLIPRLCPGRGGVHPPQLLLPLDPGVQDDPRALQNINPILRLESLVLIAFFMILNIKGSW